MNRWFIFFLSLCLMISPDVVRASDNSTDTVDEAQIIALAVDDIDGLVVLVNPVQLVRIGAFSTRYKVQIENRSDETITGLKFLVESTDVQDLDVNLSCVRDNHVTYPAYDCEFPGLPPNTGLIVTITVSLNPLKEYTLVSHCIKKDSDHVCKSTWIRWMDLREWLLPFVNSQ